jgi:ABC-type sulfate/molybdate transport systems ATPase subunit
VTDAVHDPHFLEFAVAQSFGDLSLSVTAALRSPWTILFGPSGAGKTSLLRILGGLTLPSSGKVVLRAQILTDTEKGIRVPPAERKIGFVMQNPALFPHMDVSGNVGFGLREGNRSERRQRVEELLQLVSASQLSGRTPPSLSGGERQRVALARALASEPKLLLLDEPFSGIDASLKESILQNLTEWLQRRKIPALYVSHDISEAFETTAEVIVLRNGKLEAQGPAKVALAAERDRLLRKLEASR